MTRSKAVAQSSLVRCTLPGLSVQFTDGGHVFAVGELVDLNTEAAPGVTWREALGPHAEDHFEPVADAPPDPAGE